MSKKWPKIWSAEGEQVPLDCVVARGLGVAVWIDGVTDTIPRGPGLLRVMVHRDFDDEITLRRVSKQLKRAARDRFNV